MGVRARRPSPPSRGAPRCTRQAPGGSLSRAHRGVAYATGEAHQLHVTAGLQWAVSEALDVSLIGLVGVPPGDDRYGVLLGFSPKFRLWR